MKMVQNNQLRLDEKVFGTDSILGNSFGSPPYNARETAITVEQLLTHVAAGATWNNRDIAGDRLSDRLHNEAVYSGRNAYDMKVRRMSAPQTAYHQASSRHSPEAIQ